jgi:hypothetical protein
MAISKDEHYSVYNLGIEDGKALVAESEYANEDLLELATRKLSKSTAKRVTGSGHDELVALVKNYMDGLEDGTRSGVMRERDKYRKWMDDNLS